eukprot:5098990-Prymnesium_polylepis.6
MRARWVRLDASSAAAATAVVRPPSRRIPSTAVCASGPILPAEAATSARAFASKSAQATRSCVTSSPTDTNDPDEVDPPPSSWSD